MKNKIAFLTVRWVWPSVSGLRREHKATLPQARRVTCVGLPAARTLGDQGDLGGWGGGNCGLQLRPSFHRCRMQLPGARSPHLPARIAVCANPSEGEGLQAAGSKMCDLGGPCCSPGSSGGKFLVAEKAPTSSLPLWGAALLEARERQLPRLPRPFPKGTPESRSISLG